MVEHTIESEKTFIKIMRKDKINMSSFTSVDECAQINLAGAGDKDVLSLVISMNSPLKLLKVEKVTPEIFRELVGL